MPQDTIFQSIYHFFRSNQSHRMSGFRSQAFHEPSWMKIAWQEARKGVREGKTPPDKNIIKYLKTGKYGNGNYTESTAWCGTFVAWCLLEAGYSKTQISTVPERALTWGRFMNDDEGWWPYGKQLDQPVYGCIATKERDGGGHVTFVIGIDKADKDYLHCLGGNQDNQLKVSRYERSVFHSFAVPKDYNPPYQELPVYYGTSKAPATEG